VAPEGVLLTRLRAHEDARRSLTEIFRRECIPGAGEMVQANLSKFPARAKTSSGRRVTTRSDHGLPWLGSAGRHG
jgi:hypothetical protein